MSDPSTFSISTLAVQGDTLSTSGDKIQLRGRALPYQPFELEGTMRAETTWYPGNAVATIQMIGAEEKPTVVKGMWKDKFIKSQTDEGKTVNPSGVALFNGTQVADTFSLAAAVEKMRLAGQLVRVEWDSFVRDGIIKRFRQSWVRREDLEWEMEFEWVSRGEKQSPVTLPANPSADSFVANLAQLFNTLNDAIDEVVFGVNAEFTQKINGFASTIETAITELQAGVQNAVLQVSSPLDAATRALTAVVSIKDAAQGIKDLVEQTPLRSLRQDQEVLGLGDTLISDDYSRSIKDAARQIQLSAADQADTLSDDVNQTDLLASFVARAPTDLRDISQKFYGTPDEWRSLLQFNVLDSSKVDVGDLILVPRLGTVDSRV